MFERYGIPLDTFAYRLVNGRIYSRLLPLVGADKGRDETAAETAAVARRSVASGVSEAHKECGHRAWEQDLARRASTLARRAAR